MPFSSRRYQVRTAAELPCISGTGFSVRSAPAEKYLPCARMSITRRSRRAVKVSSPCCRPRKTSSFMALCLLGRFNVSCRIAPDSRLSSAGSVMCSPVSVSQHRGGPCTLSRPVPPGAKSREQRSRDPARVQRLRHDHLLASGAPGQLCQRRLRIVSLELIQRQVAARQVALGLRQLEAPCGDEARDSQHVRKMLLVVPGVEFLFLAGNRVRDDHEAIVSHDDSPVFVFAGFQVMEGSGAPTWSSSSSSEARQAAAITGALVLPESCSGKIEQSATRRPAT